MSGLSRHHYRPDDKGLLNRSPFGRDISTALRLAGTIEPEPPLTQEEIEAAEDAEHERQHQFD